MPHHTPLSKKGAHAKLALSAPADLCRTPLSARYKLRRIRELAESAASNEWDEVPTRPIRLSAMRREG